jgi:hypothetical protein
MVSPLWSAFVGGSAPARSGTMETERCVNLYPSTVESAGNAKKSALYGTPGLKPLGTLSASPGRGRWTEDGRTFTVSGDRLYEETFTPSYAAVDLGAILDDGRPVSSASNGDGGTQRVFVVGGQLKVLNLGTNVLSAAIALPLTHLPVQVGFLDGYFVLSEADALRVWFSALEDGTSWSALDFFTRSTASDRVVGMVTALTRVWVFGSETSEAFENIGAALNPFQPIKGSLFPIGCASPWAISVDDDTIRWVGQSSRGAAVVYQLAGYGGHAISTKAIATALGGYPTLANTEALTYQQDGHTFYALTCPTAGEAGVTWVWDATESLWHQRAGWDSVRGVETAWRVRGHACVTEGHVVGSRDSGAVWTLDLDTFDDDGAILRRVRRAPYLSAEAEWIFLDTVEIGMQVGVGLNAGQGSAPDIRLNLSKDCGQTWPITRTTSLGAMGHYTQRVKWDRLGRVRADRLVLETVVTDPVRVVLGPGASLRATPGSGQR